MNQRGHTIVWAVFQALFAIALTALIAMASGCSGRKGMKTLHVLSTNDVHGAWFDSSYTGGDVKPSLMALNWYVDSVRNADGADNVLLVDVGDVLQGDNAAYYFNYVDTISPHLFPRIAEYMKYDAVIAGNHDIEAGHPVYDRVAAQMKSCDIPFMAGNAIRNDDARPYFTEYKIYKRAGLKVLVLGYDNAAISTWLSEDLWAGMTFKSLVPFVQQRVDLIRKKTRPDVVIVAVHSGTGKGDGLTLENQGLDLLESLKGVDVLLCAHDHQQTIVCRDSICLVNSGSKARYLGHACVSAGIEKGRIVSKKVDAELIKVDSYKADPAMRDHFRKEYEAVRTFTLRKVGELERDITIHDAYAGMSDYINFIHTVQLEATGAQISFSAPLTYDGIIKSGDVLYADLSTIYPYENQLFTIRLSGQEIKDYLERDYDLWIQSYDGQRVLKIARRPDARTGAEGWSFINRHYNFDSAAGLVYEVDITRGKGERVKILSLADGTPFSFSSMYSVALTSYRCNLQGWNSRIIGKLPEIRNLIYAYFLEHGSVTAASINDYGILGKWCFRPEPVASKAVAKDMSLLFEQ